MPVIAQGQDDPATGHADPLGPVATESILHPLAAPREQLERFALNRGRTAV